MGKKTRYMLGVMLGTLVLSLLCIVSVLVFAAHRRWERSEIQKLNDSEAYIVDFSFLSEGNWQSANHIRRNTEDAVGWDSSIAGATTATTYNSLMPGNYISQSVIAYTNVDQARKRYALQENWVFIYDYGVPPSRQEFPYSSIFFEAQTTSKADEYHVACQHITMQNEAEKTICTELFLYNRHVVLIEIVKSGAKNDSILECELATIFNAVDDKMSE